MKREWISYSVRRTRLCFWFIPLPHSSTLCRWSLCNCYICRSHSHRCSQVCFFFFSREESQQEKSNEKLLVQRTGCANQLAPRAEKFAPTWFMHTNKYKHTTWMNEQAERDWEGQEKLELKTCLQLGKQTESESARVFVRGSWTMDHGQVTNSLWIKVGLFCMRLNS